MQTDMDITTKRQAEVKSQEIFIKNHILDVKSFSGGGENNVAGGFFNCQLPGVACVGENSTCLEDGSCECLEGLEGFDCSLNSSKNAVFVRNVLMLSLRR